MGYSDSITKQKQQQDGHSVKTLAKLARPMSMHIQYNTCRKEYKSIKYLPLSSTGVDLDMTAFSVGTISTSEL